MRMSELDLELQSIRRAAEDDMGDEPKTPKEILADKAARAVRDCYLASAEIYKLRLDPLAAPFIEKDEADLWSIWNRIGAVISEIRAMNGEAVPPAPKLKVVSNG